MRAHRAAVMLFGRGRLRYLEGEITDWRSAGGYIDLKIGGHALRLPEERVNSRFRNRSTTRAMVREPADGEGVSELLAWQRHGDLRVHYQGMRVTPGFVFVGTAIGVVGIFAHTLPLLLIAAGILFFQLAVAVRRWWVLNAFATPEHWTSVTPPPPTESPTVPHPKIPLEFPLRQPPAVAPRASSWPSEILELTHDAIIIWEMDGAGILYWNRAAELLYGYTREQAHGRVTHELLKTELAGGVSELETRLARYGIWVGDLCHTRRDGRRVEVEARLSLMSQERRPWLVLEVNRDVTDRNRAEAARREMERQLARLRERSGD